MTTNNHDFTGIQVVPRQAYLLVLLLTLLSSSGVVAAESGSKRLNVVVILMDDLGWADLGCYGSRYYKTPALDGLAKAAIRFTNGYASCPVCSPTRAALLTGKVPARLGLTDWLPGRPDRPDQPLARAKLEPHLSLTETTLAAALAKAGYATAHVGKWHLGGKDHEPEKFGFARNIAGDHTGTPLSYFAPFQNKGRTMPGLGKAPEGEYLTDRLTAEAERFLADSKERPFFLYLAHYGVHTPLMAPAELVKKYAGTPTGGRQSNPIYAAMIEAMDNSVSRILKKLDTLKLSDNTVVVFTSDNGGLATLEGPNTPATSNAPLREGKGYLYEGGIRVPFILRVPGSKPATLAMPVVTQDLMPTLLSLCGVKAPEKLDGVDFSGVLLGKQPPKRDALYWHYPHYSNQGGKPGGAIREGNLKLIEFYEDNRRELFDLATDQGESRNLASARPEIVKRLARKLDSWRKEVSAQMPRANPNYRPHPPAANGEIVLPARNAQVTGTQLRYEPLPHKNTLGYWTDPNDQAIWQLTVTQPGNYSVEVLQGCGTGQGGSEVAIKVADQSMTFTVTDTGGFQKFVARTVGTVKFAKAGRYTLTVAPQKKAKAAVMDLRQIVLRPVKS